MATADQIKALIKAHIEHEDDRFKTVVLQIAAYEATRGHETYARELKKYAEKIGAPKGNVFRLNQQTPMLLMTIPSDRLTDLIVSDEILERIERILNEFRNRNSVRITQPPFSKNFLYYGDSVSACPHMHFKIPRNSRISPPSSHVVR